MRLLGIFLVNNFYKIAVKIFYPWKINNTFISYLTVYKCVIVILVFEYIQIFVQL